MEQALIQDDTPLTYVPKFREYGLEVSDGGSSFIEIGYCPWCGKKLPGSLREEWFDTLENLGIDPFKDVIPEEFNDERWHIVRTPD